jgi:hypothetical protein
MAATINWVEASKPRTTAAMLDHLADHYDIPKDDRGGVATPA